MGTWWRTLPLAERVALALVSLALLIGVALPSAVELASVDFALHRTCPAPELAPRRAFDPGPIAVEHDLVHEALLDPWGRPWRYERHPAFQRVMLYSAGPDGQDDQGRGDDVRMVERPLFSALAVAPWFGAGAAVLALWASFVVRAARARRGAVWLEAWRALVLVSPLTCVAVCVGSALGRVVDHRVSSPWLLVSPGTALAGTFALVLWLGGLALRLRRPPADEPDAPGSWRRPALLASSALVVVGLTAAWVWVDRAASERRRLLARACLGVDRLEPLLAAADEDLVRLFLRRNSLLARADGAGDPTYAELGRIGGPSANAFLARALARDPAGRLDFHLERTAPWRHLRAHDPRLEALLSTAADDPARYRGLVITRPELFASRSGRRAALAALAPSLLDSTGIGARQGRHDVRVCDHAAYAVARLFTPSTLPVRWPEPPADPNLIDTPYWDAVVRNTCDWVGSEPSLAPVAWIVVEVRGATVVNGDSTLDVQGGGLTAVFTAPGPEQLLVGGPHGSIRDQRVKVTDAGSGRVVQASVAVRPGETTWVVIDLARGTTQLHVQAVPP